MNNKLEFSRIFHPVGQGTFYSEEIKSNGEKFNIVYDCGSLTLEKEKFKNKIQSIFKKNQIIDILFISHFHTDHINGIEVLNNHCNIQKVVIPYLNNRTKILIKVQNYLIDNYIDNNLIDNPQKFFGPNIPIVSVNPIDNKKNEDISSSNDKIKISRIDVSQRLSSGTILVPDISYNWHFIPFNYKQNRRTNLFIKALHKNGLKIGDVDTTDKIIKNKKVVVKSYEDIEGSLNENSMILFSGTENNIIMRVKTYQRQNYYYNHFWNNKRNGCLYLGDLNLNLNRIVNDIRHKLKFYMKNIGIVQIPHHGSVYNFNEQILGKNYQMALISFGKQNRYCHPSDKVIRQIVSNKTYPLLVNEDQETLSIQWGFQKLSSPD